MLVKLDQVSPSRSEYSLFDVSKPQPPNLPRGGVVLALSFKFKISALKT